MANGETQGPARRHHFLPESYLEHWIDPASVGPNRTPVVWRVTRDGTRMSHHPPAARAFWELDAYNIDRGDGTLDDRIDRILARVEHVVAEATRGPISRREPVDRDAFDAINMFFASMVFRVPAARVALAPMFEAYARRERETLAAAGLPVPADNHLVARNGPANATADALFVVLDVLDRMTHTLLIAPPGESFVTSDRPALIHADLGFAGLANQHCEASLPLTPHVLLLLWWGGIENSCYCPTDADMMLELNRRTVARSDQWFICNRRDFDRRWLSSNS